MELVLAVAIVPRKPPLNPISLYGKTKVEAENTILDRGNCVTLRLATVFGMSPQMRLDLLVNDFTWRAVTDRVIVVFEGHFRRNYIHIRDVAKAMNHSLENFESMKGEPFNVGLSEANLSKVELCREIQKKIPSFTYVEAQIGEDPDKRNYIVSNQRLREAGFEAKRGLDAGIVELIKAYRTLALEKYRNA